MKRNILVIICVVLMVGLTFSGCIDSNNNGGGQDDGGGGLTGTATYSGTWSGSIPGNDDASGTWEYTVDFDAGTVSGWFKGDGSGDITGSVSGGTIEASGAAAFGTVEWSGTFTSDGSEVSGDWELTEYQGSGTWSGSKGEINDDNDDEDEGSGDDVESASSIRYKWSQEEGDVTRTWEYMAKNIGTDDLKVRVDFVDDEHQSGSVVINRERGKVWVVENDEWQEYSYETVGQYVDHLEDHLNYISDYWDGDPFEFQGVRFHGVELNPNLSDSLFVPPS